MSTYKPLRIVGHTTLASTAVSAESAAIGVGVSWVRVISVQSFHVNIGVGVTANTNHTYVPANREQYFRINAAERVAVIRGSIDSTVYITSMIE